MRPHQKFQKQGPSKTKDSIRCILILVIGEFLSLAENYATISYVHDTRFHFDFVKGEHVTTPK